MRSNVRKLPQTNPSRVRFVADRAECRLQFFKPWFTNVTWKDPEVKPSWTRSGNHGI